MKVLTRYIILIESRVRGAFWALIAMSLMTMLWGPLAAQAQAQGNASNKVASDLREAMHSTAAPKHHWAKDLAGGRYVRALIVSSSADPELTDLRSHVLAVGGSVYMRYMSVSALSVLLPASRIDEIAQRPDVQSISPNRLTTRTASSLEMATGAADLRSGASSGAAGLNGTGVGIAVLDSGVAASHRNFLDASGRSSRVAHAVDFQKAGDASGRLWRPGIDVSASWYQGGDDGRGMSMFERLISADHSKLADPYGHGSHVASIAAGSGHYQSVDSTGVAPNANIFDVKVLDAAGNGELGDVLAGIDWVIYHAREYNIRVLNVSLASDSSESYLTDPLCRAVRSAVASGITVVVAAGNYGLDENGAEVYGTISSPGNDPSVITVGSANTHGTPQRSDDSVNFFSSRGPTRGAYVDASGVRYVDNLLKPDLVAPGNKIVGVLASDRQGSVDGFSYLPRTYPGMAAPYGGTAQPKLKQLMNLSGTSVSAPVVSGAVALMLQANPGLTPPLVKAILQYSAQPIPDANLLEQGAGLLNVEGAVKLAGVLRSDLASAIESGRIAAGAPMLAPGKMMPSPVSRINGANVPWSRIVFAGGSHVLSGSTLFEQYQSIYDPRLVWVRDSAQRYDVSYWPAATREAPRTWVKSIVARGAPTQPLLTAGVVLASPLAGDSSLRGETGVFIPTATLSGWLASGSGLVLSEGIFFSKGLVLSEGFWSKGLVLSEGFLSKGLVLSEGFLSKGLVLSEGFWSKGLVLSEGLVHSEGLVLSKGLVLSEGHVLSEGQAGVTGEP
ncbi:MAG: S8 family peptidase [Burkholderiales bacterium]|nr:S8 family peptidase [Burkholderiales bacterium]